jgi:pimeloyl-ACP methyl ester carboxylesterase
MSAIRESVSDRIHHLTARMQGWGEYGGPVRAHVNDLHNLRSKNRRNILILVHGFKNTTSDANASYKLQLGLLEKHFMRSPAAPDAIIFFHWPGNFGWVGATGYPWDIRRAVESADRLARYIADYPRPSDPGAFKVTIIGHSLGCRLILEMLNRLPPRARLSVQVVSLMAPAVPVELVDIGGDLHPTILSPRHILKCFSHHDWVLRFAFQNGQQAAYALGIEDEFYGEAVGLKGHPTAMGIPIQTRHGHSDYWGNRAVAEEYSKAIDETFRPLPPVPQPAVWSLPETSKIPTWQLPSRQ